MQRLSVMLTFADLLGLSSDLPSSLRRAGGFHPHSWAGLWGLHTPPALMVLLEWAVHAAVKWTRAGLPAQQPQLGAHCGQRGAVRGLRHRLHVSCLNSTTLTPYHGCDSAHILQEQVSFNNNDFMQV